MYAHHQPQISTWGRQSPDNFAKIAEFVLGTIRVRLRDAAEAARSGERPSNVFFGNKHDGLAYLDAHKDALWYDAEQAENDDQLMTVMMRIPGIGAAKAGFLCQLLYGRVGCLDTHNIARFGLDPECFELKQGKKTPARRRWECVQSYIKTCASLGSSQQLWDGWCEFVGARDGDHPFNISALHLAPLQCAANARR